MNENLVNLQEKINRLKKEEKDSHSLNTQGYRFAVFILTDLCCCILVGFSIGFFFQKVFHTSILLTAGLTLLGGIAGFWNVIRFVVSQEKGKIN